MKVKTGVLLLNLGTPDGPDTRSVRRYLRQFLSDNRIIDVPAVIRYLILYLFILPFRPARSAHAYQSIWTSNGSPLLVYTSGLTEKIRRLFAAEPHQPDVRFAMRYGNPSIRSVLTAFRRDGIREVFVILLFPQYAAASSGSAMAAVYTEAAALWDPPVLRVLPPFFHTADYLNLVAKLGRPILDAAPWDHVLFSFHGIPVRQLKRSEEPGTCTQSDTCCLNPERHWCYRAACIQTATQLATRLGIPASDWSVSFQSRLGRTEWIQPYTETLLSGLPATGKRHLVVFSPAFTADCLETLEELGMRGAEAWKSAGGDTFRLVPALNDSDEWAALLTDWIRREQLK